MTSLFAFLHHLAAFTLFAALVVELILIREVLTVGTARKLQIADMVFGISAGVLVIVGLLRVFYFEKGAIITFTPGLLSPSSPCSSSSAWCRSFRRSSSWPGERP